MKRFVLIMLLFGTLIRAQTSGTISGAVQDATGAVVPGATITATQIATNQSRSATADSAGQYVLPLLPLGEYRVRVEKDGFAPFVQQGITLQANSQVEANVTLQVRASAEQITVSSTASMVQTTSTTLVQVVDSQRVADLPLNGRNVLQLLSINAGVSDRSVPVTVQGTNIGGADLINTVSINGSRGSSTNYLLDNSDNNEAQTSLARPFPNPDAVQEFSIQTSSFDAEYGRGVGGIVNVVTKSGTNAFHGTAFDFLRNYDLNASNFFSGRDAVKRNQFGGTLGGPVRKDQDFFFMSYQGTRNHTATPGALRTAPSAAMRNGDFSEWLLANGTGVIRDRAGNPYPDNIIPRASFDPVSVKLLSLMPTSTASNYQVRFGTPTRIINDDQALVRGDHQFSGGNRISLRYFYLRSEDTPTILPNNVLYATDGVTGSQHSFTLNHTYSFSPKWLNNLTASLTTSQPARLTAAQPNISLQNLGARVRNAVDVNLIDVSINGWSGVTLGNYGLNFSRSIHLINTTSYATGRHNLRFGGEMRVYRTGFTSYFQTGGANTFNGLLLSVPGRQNTGNSYAEFLLGTMSSFRQTSVSRLHADQELPAFFVQDDFRINTKLTLNLGLRWDPKPGFDEGLGQHTTFVQGRQSTAFPNAPPGLLFTGDKGYENRVIPDNWKNFGPRVGVAWQFLPKTVMRAAYGIFYDEYFGLFYNRVIQGPPWIDDASLSGVLQFSNPFGSAPVLEPEAYKAGSNYPFRDFSTYAGPTDRMRAGYIQNWNYVIERELPGSVLLRASYVGSKGTDLVMTKEVNPGIYGPGATAANINQRRPLARIGALALGYSDSNSSYNSMQITVQKRHSKGFSVLGNYTWGRSIDYASFSSVSGNNAGPDPFNLRNARGFSNWDIKHRVSVSGLWEMPRLNRANPVIKAVLGGWQQNGILTLETGIPLTVVSGADNNFDGVTGDYADYLGGDWKIGGDRSKSQQIARWFNTSVFRSNAVGTFGSGRRAQLRGPGAWNLDYSLFKSFDLIERLRLQLRGEFFNVFNHANLGSPGTTVNSTTFGVISGASSPRIVQVAMKLIF
ncbi:MAG TPA: carboxypeptidase regulatory-like domain-containing protein [Bryobacteraceae bacterium]|nr:carboxypeptidase regulatory-like domain-containing protein [Bryobacteraceae bacterium]